MLPPKAATLGGALLACLVPLTAAAAQDSAAQDSAPKGTAQPAAEREPGLTLRLFQLEQAPEELPILVPNQTPNVDRVVATLELAGDDFAGVASPHLTRALGWLQIDEPGSYRLMLASDDGSRLFLDGEKVLDNDGRHGVIKLISRPLELAAGAHELLVEHFDSGGSRELWLGWERPGTGTFEVVPRSALLCETDPTRVTSPGPKAVIDARKPGDGLPVPGVHPAWRVETIRPEGFEAQVGAMAFLPDGRLAFGTFDPLQRDEVKLPDIDAKAPDVIWALDLATSELSKIATNVFEPSGLCVVDGELYVAQRRAVVKLTDGDGDGYMETHEIVGEGWEGWNYHQFCFGLVYRDGCLYTALSTAMAPPNWEGMHSNSGSNGPLRGSFIEIDLSSGDTRAIAGGARTPNGLGLDGEGRLLYADNQGSWMPASVLAEVVPGRFYGHYNWTQFVPKVAERFPDGGHPSIFSDRPRSAPALWLPHGEVVNSPTEPLAIPSGSFAGQLYLGELTGGGIRRAFLEEVDGVLQGALFRFTQGLESGVNRMEWGPDGALYVGGIGAGGNWNWNGTRFGLQRLVPTGAQVFEIHSVRATPTGFAVRFTEAIDADLADVLANATCKSWTYAPTREYGGPKVDERDHAITRMEPTPDGMGLELDVDGLREGTCVHLRLDPRSANGDALWSAECWYTLNHIPMGSGGDPLAGVPVWNGSSGPTMRLEGSPPEANLTQAELIAADPWITLTPAGADLVTTTSVQSPKVHLEWRLADPQAPLPQAWVEWGDFEYRLPLDSAIDGWQEFDASWFELGSHPSTPAFTDPTRQTRRGTRVGGGIEADGEARTCPVAIRVEGSAEAGAIQVRNVRLSEQWPRGGFTPGPWREILADDSAWEPRGGAAVFTLQDGVLSGETRPNTPNTFWTSRETFRDFELVYDVRIDPALNSGVQIRSEVIGGFDNRDGGLKGYQVEIDPSERAWSGGIYEERGRGWLHPLHAAPYARRAWRQGEWNHFRVLCEGPTIRTWINGVPAAEMIDHGRAAGHIGFQVHGVGDRAEPLQVAWRHVRLRRLIRD
ncbi:family 16 glycoside hydrolase [Engelhardtia mirabilis]|uniref:PA14 domain protein n=1 Tax=Engelhardtia mirabilis TaxID=2528011 RepID=A0A518BRY4_9BACT|nr:PA14 domain protein [Planctomycetes bacterium Pla133]QDV04060.1 PA14 domain protein [Planctomycetes bacterium Pla86]